MFAIRALLIATAATLVRGDNWWGSSCNSGITGVSGGGISWNAPMEMNDGAQVNPGQRSYVFSNTPSYMAGGTYISSRTWPSGSDWTLTIDYVAPATLYVWVSETADHNAGLDAAVSADGWTLEAAPSFQRDDGKLLKVWGKFFAEGTSTTISPLTGTMVAGVVSTCEYTTATTTTTTVMDTTKTTTTTTAMTSTSTTTTTVRDTTKTTTTTTTLTSTSTTTTTTTATTTDTTVTATITTVTETTTATSTTTTTATTTSSTVTTDTATTTTTTTVTTTYTGTTTTETTVTTTTTPRTTTQTITTTTTETSMTTTSTTVTETSSTATTMTETTTSLTTTTTTTSTVTTSTSTETTVTTTTTTSTTTGTTVTTSTSTTTTTTTIHRIAQFDGNLYLTVDEPDQLIEQVDKNPAVQEAIETGIASSVAGVEGGMVRILGAELSQETTTTTTLARRLRSASPRRLQGVVAVSYRVQVTVEAASRDNIAASTFVNSEAAMSTAITTALQTAAPGITVQSVIVAEPSLNLVWSSEEVQDGEVSPENSRPGDNESDGASGGWIVILLVSVAGVCLCAVCVPIAIRRVAAASKSANEVIDPVAASPVNAEEDFSSVETRANDLVTSMPTSHEPGLDGDIRFPMPQPVSFNTSLKDGGISPMMDVVSEPVFAPCGAPIQAEQTEGSDTVFSADAAGEAVMMKEDAADLGGIVSILEEDERSI